MALGSSDGTSSAMLNNTISTIADKRGFKKNHQLFDNAVLLVCEEDNPNSLHNRIDYTSSFGWKRIAAIVNTFISFTVMKSFIYRENEKLARLNDPFGFYEEINNTYEYTIKFPHISIISAPFWVL